MKKEHIREIVRRERAGLSPRYREWCASAALVGLFGDKCLNLFRRFRNFASYISVPEEFPTGMINRQILGAGRTLAVPRYDDAHSVYAFNAMPPGCPLRSGPRNIPEPEPFFPVIKADLEVIFMPGLAFNYTGQRIGYGGGVYDRLLQNTRRSTLKIALAFDCQLFEDSFPQEPHDVPVDYVVTERQIVDCRRNRTRHRDSPEG